MTFTRLQGINGGIQYPWSPAQAATFRTAYPYKVGNAVSPDFPGPKNLQWTLGVQREITRQMVLDMNYVGNHAYRLVYNNYPNRVDRLTGFSPTRAFRTSAIYLPTMLHTTMLCRWLFSSGCAVTSRSTCSYTWSHTMSVCRWGSFAGWQWPLGAVQSGV